jgi:hypothetical protein
MADVEYNIETWSCLTHCGTVLKSAGAPGMNRPGVDRQFMNEYLGY